MEQKGDNDRSIEDLSVPFLGSIPIDPEICSDSDNGVAFIIEHPDSSATKAFTEIVKKIEGFLKHEEQSQIRKKSIEKETGA